MPETILHVVSEDVEGEHVTHEMHPSAVEEDEGEKGGDLMERTEIVQGFEGGVVCRNQSIQPVDGWGVVEGLKKDKEVDGNEGGGDYRQGSGGDGVS